MVADVFTTYPNGFVMDDGMVLYNIDGRSEANGTVVTKTLVAKVDGFSEFNVGSSANNARYVLNGHSKLNGGIGATTFRVELDGFSSVSSSQITFERSAVFEIDGRSSISTKQMSGAQGAKFTAQLDGFSKMSVGSGRASEGSVSVSGRSEFSALKFDVHTLTVGANDYSTADVYCSGKLRAITTSQQARINFSGSCTVESESPTIIRK